MEDRSTLFFNATLYHVFRDGGARWVGRNSRRSDAGLEGERESCDHGDENRILVITSYRLVSSGMLVFFSGMNDAGLVVAVERLENAPPEDVGWSGHRTCLARFIANLWDGWRGRCNATVV